METLALVGAILVLLAVVAVVAKWLTGMVGERRRRSFSKRGTGIIDPTRPFVLTLDIDATNPDDARVQRLAEDAVRRARAANPDLNEVVVRDRTGRTLLESSRPAPPPPLPDEPDLPRGVPRRKARRSPSPVRRPASAHPVPPHEVGDDKPPPAVFADRFDLPAAVREGLEDPDDPRSLVEALLRAGGAQVEVRRGCVVADGRAIIVMGYRQPATPEALSRAYLDYRESNANEGVVIGLGFVDARELRRREALDPSLQHAGPEAIQRMADAVALGGDPLAFLFDPTTD